MEAEEFLRHRGWGATLHLLRDVEDFGKNQYNQSIEDCIAFMKDWYENERYFENVGEEGKDFYTEILKLKKL